LGALFGPNRPSPSGIRGELKGLILKGAIKKVGLPFKSPYYPVWDSQETLPAPKGFQKKVKRGAPFYNIP